MSEVPLANIFFIITGSAVLVVGTFLCIELWHLIKITRKARAMLDRVDTYGEALMDDVQAFRDYVTQGNIFGRIVTAVVSTISVLSGAKRTAPRKKKDSENQEE